MNYLLSIIIPTKNRSFYCLYAVKQIVSLGFSNVEICIQDNSDTDDLKKEIESLECPNIVYHYNPKLLSFVDNFSEAVSISHGEYLCMIGDDDGVLSNIVSYTEVAKRENLDAIIPNLGFIYHWPSKEEIAKGAKNGLLYLTMSPPQSKLVNPSKGLKTLLSNAIQDYTSLDIPRLYHGIVKRSILYSIKEKTGVFFGGLTPDMFMAVELALECKTVLRLSDSVTISGICPKSGSADSATGKHTGDLSSAPHFRGHDSYNWDDRVPAFYSVDTIWADTLFHALTISEREDLIRFFNMPLFESICLKRYPNYSSVIKEHATRNNINGITMTLSYYAFRIKKIACRVSNKVRRETQKRIFGKHIYFARECNIPDIIDATRMIDLFKEKCKVDKA